MFAITFWFFLQSYVVSEITVTVPESNVIYMQAFHTIFSIVNCQPQFFTFADFESPQKDDIYKAPNYGMCLYLDTHSFS